MYPAAITWKAKSGGTCGSEDNTGSNGSMSGVDELFNNIRSLKKKLDWDGDAV